MSSSDGLSETAHLVGRLWLREVDEEFLAEIANPELRDALAAFDLQLPQRSDGSALNELAADYFKELVHPASRTPPVQSLVQEGKYEGAAAIGIRQVADALSLELDQLEARGAPVDHLGVELALWGELAERSPQSAAEFASTFLAWASPWCRSHAPSVPGFYGRLFALTANFIDMICGGSGDASD